MNCRRSLFWYVTLRTLAVVCRRFGTACPSRIQGSSGQRRCLTFQKSEDLNSKPDKQYLLLIPGISSTCGKLMLFYRYTEEGSILLSETVVAFHQTARSHETESSNLNIQSHWDLRSRISYVT